MKTRKFLKNMPGLRVLYSGLRTMALRAIEIQTVNKLRLRAGEWKPDFDLNLVVSLTSFPARIEHVWIAIESIFQQDLKPTKVVLVLSEEEFPTKSLPKTLRKQEARGLEILWTPKNTRSFKKLLPTREKYPDATIVTVDDDIIYEPWRLRKLVDVAKTRPGTIIGHRGWVVTKTNNGLAPYITWPKAGPDTPSELCFLTSGGGVLYPPNLLPLDDLLNIDLALQLCPLADDIWFWAIAKKAGVPSFCLGNHRTLPVRSLRSTPKLETENRLNGGNDAQLAAIIESFGWVSGCV